MHGLDVEAEMINIISYELGAEIDRQIVTEMVRAAITGGSVSVWSPAMADGLDQMGRLSTLLTQITIEANQIALKTRRGNANFVVTSPRVCALLEQLSLNKFVSIQNSKNIPSVPDSGVGAITKTGMINDGQQLLDEEQHGTYLDRFGKTEKTLSAYQKEYSAMTELKAQIKALKMDEAEKARRMDSLRFQIGELERAELVPGEEEELAARRNILRNGEKYIGALSGADYCLSGDDECGGAVSQLREAEEAMSAVRNLGDDLAELYKRLEELRCEAYDLAEIIRDKRAEFDFSPAELDAVESRSDQLYRLKKKYGATVEDMLAYLDKCRAELDAIETADDTLILLEQKLKKAETATLAAGAELTRVRREAAKVLEGRIQRELRDLDMNKVRFAIEFTEKEPSSDGCDTIRFLMSANVGEDLRPIARIASGGELARIMLALKNVLAEQESIGTLVFDEVDTGVSGRAAQKVAEKLAQVSRRKQVLCVTHLPQLAAMADTHFSVEKGEWGGRTYTEVILLNREQRKAELARITGGIKVTEALLESAGELLDEAETYRKSI